MKGNPPAIGGDGGRRKKVSVIGAVGASPTGRHPGPYFATLPDGFFTADEVVLFLRDLLRRPRGKVVVVWDRGPNHEGPRVRAFLRRNRRLRLELLPAHAPELNPVEQAWGWPKYGELANYVPEGLAELDDEVIDRLIELKFDPGLLRNLWDASELPSPKRRRVKQH